jgi:hypothetical protein
VIAIPCGDLGGHLSTVLEYFLFRKKYTGMPEKMRMSPIAASRGLVIIVLKNSPIQNRIKMAGTTG